MSSERKDWIPGTDIDDKILDGVETVKKGVQDLLDSTDVDDKIIDGAKQVAEELRRSGKEALDKTDIDEKIIEGVGKAAGYVKDGFQKIDKDGKIAEAASDLYEKVEKVALKDSED